jgi:twitching motility protein PilT
MTEITTAMIDRRTTKRKRSALAMRYRIFGGDGREYDVSTVDLSSNAVLFETSELISIGTQMSMELDLPSGEKPIRAEGSIIRIEERERGQRYFCCLFFDKISPENKRRIEQYIQIIDVENLLRLAVAQNASDVHFVADKPPIFRIEGKLVSLDFPPLSPKDMEQMILTMLTEKQKNALDNDLELNFSYLISEGIRFRVNVHFEKGNMEASLRIIPSSVKTFADLGLPPVLEEWVQKQKGLIIITGPAGAGTTTTLSAMIETISENRNCMIVSIEDPIEYVHKSKKSIIKQREVGADTLSFTQGLRNALRQDPDVIFISELCDPETISMALTAAEQGHLVLSTMHTIDTVECINRLVDVFPVDQQEQIRSRLSACLEGVMAQTLLPRKDGQGRVAATEVLVGTPTIRKLIRENKHGRSISFMEAGLKVGMQGLDSSLQELVVQGLVEEHVAKGYAKAPEMFKPKMTPVLSS